MKKNSMLYCMSAALLLICTSTAQALTGASLDGNSFETTMFCTDDAGAFCDTAEFMTDTFIFSGGSFELAEFGKAWLGLGSGGGYTDSGLMFSATYRVVNESLDKYDFTISGMNLIDMVIMGTMQVIYYDWNIINYKKEDEATVFFLGFRQ